VSFDTVVVTGYRAEAEFPCDKAAMFGDTIKRNYITDLSPDIACDISLSHKRFQRNCYFKFRTVALLAK
jgi:hypothetical protein